MYKFIILIVLALISGCKDKHEKALDAVIDTSMSVRKCQLKYLANEKPSLPCGQIEHNIAIEEARIYGIKENRIEAAVSSGKLQVDKISANLIRKGNHFQTASDYKSRSNDAYLAAKTYRNNLKLFQDGIDITPDHYLDLDKARYVPDACSKHDFEMLENFRSRKIYNKNYSPKECLVNLKHEIDKEIKDGAAWIEKANEQELDAKRIKSEY